MTTYLDRILDHKREEVARQQQKVPLATIQARCTHAPPVRSLSVALRHADRVALIAEVKHKSPSRGVLVEPFDPVAIARTYLDNGADAISVLTDVRFFGGSLQYLKAIRALPTERSVPVLRKDFIIDPYQVWEARAYGADALLLIVAALDDGALRALLDLTESLGMEALVEVHDTAELARAIQAGATIVGVNNRDLRSFNVSLETTERVAAALPDCDPPILVSESGIHTLADIQRLRQSKADAILVGEALVQARDRAAQVRQFAGKNA